MRVATIAIVWCLYALAASAQLPWEGQPQVTAVGQTQVTFLRATMAELISDGESVLILAEELAPGREFGVKLEVEKDVLWVEVHDSQVPFPPRVQQPYQPGQFLIRGKPKQEFWVSLRTNGPPEWVQVIVAPSEVKPEPPVDPPSNDFSALTQLSKKLADSLNDPFTRESLKKAYTATVAALRAQCSGGTCPGLDAAKTAIIDAVNAAPKTPAIDWYYGYRKPTSDAINGLNITQVDTYLAAIEALALGL